MRTRLSISCTALLLLMTLPAAPSSGQGLSSTESRMASFVDAHSDEMIDLLERVTNINSGTLNVDGVREVGRVFDAEFRALGFETEWVAVPDSLRRAGHFFARHQGSGNGKRMLLIGHLDTVFEKDDPFQVFERNGDRAVGPGVSDMKGGDVVILYALKAMKDAGLLDEATVTVALIGDEEDPGYASVSRVALVEAARASDVALAFEGGDTKTATIARRGFSSWRLEVTGRQAHSSGVFGGGSAIYEAARILDGFYSYVRGEQYLTFNPGMIVGGTEATYDSDAARGTAFGKTNVIANTVVVEGDLRFISEEQKTRARERMRAIVASGGVPRTSATIEFADSYPAMPPTDGNRAILEVLDGVGRDLGHGPVEALDPGARGAGDVSFVAHLVDGLDGLGVDGGNGHAPGEWVDLGSMTVMAQRAAVLMARLARMAR